jgi:hypothetical protein
MDKKPRNLFLTHLLVPGVVLMVYLLFFGVIHLPIAILMLIGIEIVLNIKYPIINFRRYFTANAIGTFIFMSIYILWHKNMPSFERHWLLSYNGILVVILAPLLGYGLRKILLDRKQKIYLAHMLMPGMIMLVMNIVTTGSIHGSALVMSLLMVILWQIYGSVGITTRNFWKFYLANVVGLVLFVMAFSYEQLFIMSLPNWIEENSWLLDKVLAFSLFGLLGGWIISNVNFKPIDDSQRVSQHEQSKPEEKE